MDSKQIIKNMEYWKKKNNIPGIDTVFEAGLTGDGKASSAPFQMTTPGGSPNKNFWKRAGKFFNPMTGGPMGALWRSMTGGGKQAAQAQAFGAGGGTYLPGAFGTISGNVGDGVGPQEELVQVPQQTTVPMVMKKSPVKQEGEVEDMKETDDPTERIYIEGDYKEGDLITEDDFESQFKRTGEDPKDYPQLSVQDYSEIRVDEKGMYIQKLEEGEKNVSPSEKNVPQGPMGPGGMDITGGVDAL
tara:strand:- start:81 stop:812 length:732 start_codon:yes stop_codon:yes gene_type:complete